jgi:hypothetical protein
MSIPNQPTQGEPERNEQNDADFEGSPDAPYSWLSLRIPRDLSDWINRAARKDNRDRSKFVRELLDRAREQRGEL